MKQGTWAYDAFVFGGFFLRPYWRLGIEGAVESIPRTGPLLVVSNHASFLDPWFLSFVFPRRIHYLMTDTWYYRSKFWEWLFAACATEPMRGGHPRETIKAVCRILARGQVTGIFPEGGISSDGKLQRFRPGLARIAATSGAPVLPVVVDGSFRSLPRNRRFPLPTRVRIRVGEPLVFPGAPFEKTPDRQLRDDFTDLVLSRVQALMAQD